MKLPLPSLQNWFRKLLFGTVVLLSCQGMASSQLNFASAGDPVSNQLDSFISIKLQNAKVGELLDAIENNSDIRFVYDKSLLQYGRAFTLVEEDTPIYHLLQKISGESDLRFQQVNSNINVKLLEREPEKIPMDILEVTVTGTVNDQNGEPIPGATVSVPGTGIGTATDIDGRYSITVPEGSTLVFSFIGYETQSIAVGDQSLIDVTLTEDVSSLDEVIVVGYGTVQKRHLTGSVGSIQMDETLASRPVVDFGQAMYGKVAGVQVLNPSGRPGESSRIQIRGINSISAGSEPLIVVDGVPLPNYDLNTINPTDIESIEILKDAASAAIYGSRGANGVVLVTTKSGKAGKPLLTVNYTYSNQRVMKRVDVMNGPEYAQAAIDAAQNGWIDSGGDPNAPNTIEARGEYRYTWPEALEHPETLANTDWQDISYRVAPMHKADISFSGGDENTRYFISAGIVDQQGIVIKSDYQKYTLNMKADANVNNWLSVGGMLNVAYDKESDVDSYTLTGATQYPSIYPVYADNGLLGGPSTIDGFENHYGILFRAYHGHPYQGLNEDDLYHRVNTAGNLFAEIEIMEGLKFRNAFTAFYRRADNTYYSPVDRNLGVNYRARFDSEMSRTLNHTMENLLIYDKTWNDHQINVVAGYESNYREIYSLFGRRYDYDNDLIRYLSGGNTIEDADDGASEYRLVSILGRVNYNFKDKYMASATFRRDGSSRFGPANKWGNFPSLSAGWRLSEEDFMGSIDVVSNLNIRASYGFTGNDNFGNYQWISAMRQGRPSFGENLATAYYPSSVENPDLAWERTKQLNIGVDIGLLDDRISLEANYYKSESDGLLLDVPVPSVSGFTSVFQNIGALENNGLELALTSHNLTGDLTWNSQVTFSRNRAVITQTGPDNAPMIIRRTNMDIINEVGQAPFSFFAYEYDGVYMNQNEIDSDPVEYPFPVHPGHGRYKDINGDGIISADDRTIIGNGQPDFIWALTNNFKFRDFDFSFMFHGSVGGEVYDAVSRRSMFYHEGRNYLGRINNRWRSEENPGDGYHYKLSVDIDGLEKVASSYWLTNGTYTRLRDVTLGYTLPQRYAESVGVTGARIYFNGTNLFSIQKTTAIDPENSSGSITDSATIGVQFSPYPSAKTYSLGLNVTF